MSKSWETNKLSVSPRNRMATPAVTQVGDVSHRLLRAKEWAELEDDLWEAPEDPEQKKAK